MTSPPPFLDDEPPHWAARGLTYLLILLVATAGVGAVAIRVPETVSGTFALVPVRGTDPIRSARDGVLEEVRVREGQAVEKGTPLFVIRSQPVGDRFADLETMAAQREGAEQRLANEGRRHRSQRLANHEAAAKLRARMDHLARIVPLKERQLASARELAERYREGFEGEAISYVEYARAQTDVDRLAVEVEQTRAERSEVAAVLEQLEHEMRAGEAEFAELERGLREEMEKAEIRIAALDEGLGGGRGGQLVVTAPCTGTLLRLAVRRGGAVVQEGDRLGELACGGEGLQVELALPQAGVALVRPGQRVKLLYDAFPYQRYGVRYGTLRWISPTALAEAGAGEERTFRALADTPDEAVRVRGRLEPLRPGMGGKADVLVGRRSLVSYAFEPLRQLRESVAQGPES